MTANATHTGFVAIPGTDIGLPGELIASPLTQNMMLTLDDRLTFGPRTVRLDDDGYIQSPGLQVPIKSGLMWNLAIQFDNRELGRNGYINLGDFNLNVSGDIKDLPVEVALALSETDYGAIFDLIDDLAAHTGLDDLLMTAVLNLGGSAFRAALTRTGTKPVGRGETVHNILDFATNVGGGTNDTAALNAAIAAAGAVDGTSNTVYLPNVTGGYSVTVGSIVGAAGVRILGEYWVPIKARNQGGTSPIIALNAAGMTAECITVDGHTFAPHQGIKTSAANTSVKCCYVKNITDSAGSTGGGIMVGAGSSNVLVKLCTADTVAIGIHVADSGADTVRVDECTVKNWTARGIRFLESGSTAAKNIWVTNNKVTNCIGAAADARVPISFNYTGTQPYYNVDVIGNIVVGNDTSNEDTTTPGTADQIMCHGLRNFTVANNISENGGEAGISVTLGCKHGTVSGNVSKRADGTGIHIWGEDIVVTGNKVVDPAMDRSGLKGASAYNAFAVKYGRDISFVNNHLKVTPLDAASPVANFAALPTASASNYGKGVITTDTGHMWVCNRGSDYETGVVYTWLDAGAGGASKVTNSINVVTGVGVLQTANIRVGPNNFPDAYKIINTDGTVIWDVPPRVSMASSNVTRNNTATQTDDPEITLTFAANATYIVEMLWGTSADTAADVGLAFTMPTGAGSPTLTWTPDSLTTAALAAGTSVVLRNSPAGAGANIGGAGVGVVTWARPTGILVTSSQAGSITPKWAQNTAQANDIVRYAGSYMKLTRVK